MPVKTEGALSSYSPFTSGAQRDGGQHIVSLSCPNHMAAGLQRHKWGISRAVFSQPQSSWAAHIPSLPPFRPPECPDLTLCFALEISEGFKDSSLDSTQTMFLLAMYTGGGRIKGGGRMEPTPFQKRGHTSLCLALMELPPCTATSSCWWKNAKSSSSPQQLQSRP